MEEKAEIVESKEPTKEELERAKILLEIEELKKEWWKKPTYIAALFPTVLALATLIYGFTNGYFQASFIKLENQKYDLQNEIKAFEAEKTALRKQVEENETAVKATKAKIEEADAELKTQKDNLREVLLLLENMKLELNNNESIKDIKSLEQSVKKATKHKKKN
jgi:uncharacterized protein HemX